LPAQSITLADPTATFSTSADLATGMILQSGTPLCPSAQVIQKSLAVSQVSH